MRIRSGADVTGLIITEEACVIVNATDEQNASVNDGGWTSLIAVFPFCVRDRIILHNNVGYRVQGHTKHENANSLTF